ncbi:MAG TPA: COR domain-containing protein [Saprospiraceae bacterium]|nr:COR domain-containing protein [Saprospiraceae bacterium]
MKFEEGYQLGFLTVFDNPLTHPPVEIVSQGNAAILRYFEDLEKQGTDQIYEAKLLLIGEGSAGKTTLCRKLFDPNAPLPQEKDRTKGIDIHPLHFDIPAKSGKQFRLNIWDFAGQGKYQSAHSFFYTHRSLYVLVDDTRTLSENDAYRTLYNNWLQTTELFGGNSPVLVLHNEKEGCARTGFSLGSFQDRFPFVHGELFRINLGGGETDKIEDLRRQIERRALALPHIGDTVPKTWVKVREALEVEKKDHPYISVERYRELCTTAGITDPERQSDLSHYFHDLGVFLHFQDNPLLKRDVFLQNTWVTDAVYKILDDAQIVEVQRGRFSKNDLNRLWQESTYRERRDELLALMLQFELCYQVQDSDTYICPQLLPGDVPAYSLGQGFPLQLKYEYGFMPKGLLYRLMVRLHRHIAQGQTAVWNAGVVLERAGSMAEITESLDRRTISVRATGLRAKELVTIINEELERLHAPFGERLKVEVKIPCNCRICHKSQKPHFYDKTDLDKRLERGKNSIECSESYDDVPVRGLLDGVFMPIGAIPKDDKLDSESKERILVGEVTVLIAKAGQIGREKNVGDHGIDMEVEFKADSGTATGKFVYLQLKSGDSYLNRQKDGIEYFKIPKDRHFDYWKDIIAPVILVIRRSNGEILWMEIQEFLRQQFALGNRPKTIPFIGEKLTPESVLQWRANVLGNG